MSSPIHRAAALQRTVHTIPHRHPSARFAHVLAHATKALNDSVPFADTIKQAAAQNGIDPALLAAVAKTESNFNPSAQSPAGAKGLMQLMDATARGLGVSDPFDPVQSLNAGARFLGALLKQFNGDVRLALAAYNAGPGAVQRYGDVPPYQETQRYIPRVLATAAEFRRISANTMRPNTPQETSSGA